MVAEAPTAPPRELWKEAEPGRCGEASPKKGFYRSWGDSAGPGSSRVSAMEP